MAGKAPALVIAAAVLASLVGGPASADQSRQANLRVSSERDAAFGQSVVPTLAPFAHVLFCKTHRAECAPDNRGARILDASAETMKTIQGVNNDVNRQIRPASDASGPLGDVWSLSPKRGDCEDFVLTKRQRLRQAGFPTGALRVAVTRTSAGEGHAVLIVTTSKGNLVLDNRMSKIVRWQDARLTMVKLQSAKDPQLWYAMNDVVAQNDLLVAERNP